MPICSSAKLECMCDNNLRCNLRGANIKKIYIYMYIYLFFWLWDIKTEITFFSIVGSHTRLANTIEKNMIENTHKQKLSRKQKLSNVFSFLLELFREIFANCSFWKKFKLNV